MWLVTAWNNEPATGYPLTLRDLDGVKLVQRRTLTGNSFRILNVFTNAQAVVYGTVTDQAFRVGDRVKPMSGHDVGTVIFTLPLAGNLVVRWDHGMDLVAHIDCLRRA